MFELDLDPTLVEEAVLLATDASEPNVRRRYRRERDALYEIEDDEEREAAFSELDSRWFARLGLAAPLRQLLEGFPSIGPRVSGCSVLLARRAKEEGCDLHRVRGAAIPRLVVKLTPASLLRFDSVSRLLRSELLHVEDMLDPDFGYEPELPSTDGGATYQNLVRNRYCVLWNTTVDGRLAARGLLSKGEESRTRREFLAVFPSSGEAGFERLFRGTRPSHREILTLALGTSETCALCELPTTAFHPHPEKLADAIRSDFPRWNPSRGICRQCADLYEARALPSR